MIADNIRNASRYYGISDGIRAAFDYIATHDLTEPAPGRYKIDGDKLHLIIVEYDTKPLEQGAWETHRQYADVQFVVSGTELMGRADVSGLSASIKYDADKDIEFFSGDGAFFTMAPGDFAVFFPDDAHMPGMTASSPQPVRKAVMKVLIG